MYTLGNKEFVCVNGSMLLLKHCANSAQMSPCNGKARPIAINEPYHLMA